MRHWRKGYIYVYIFIYTRTYTCIYKTQLTHKFFRNRRRNEKRKRKTLCTNDWSETGYSVLSMAGRSICRGFRLLAIVCMYTTFDDGSLDRLERWQIELFEVGDPNLGERGCTRLCATFATTNSVATVFGRYSVNNQPRRRSTRRRATQRNNSIPAFPVPSHFASSRLSTLLSVSFIGHTRETNYPHVS